MGTRGEGAELCASCPSDLRRLRDREGAGPASESARPPNPHHPHHMAWGESLAPLSLVPLPVPPRFLQPLVTVVHERPVQLEDPDLRYPWRRQTQLRGRHNQWGRDLTSLPWGLAPSPGSPAPSSLTLLSSFTEAPAVCRPSTVLSSSSIWKDWKCGHEIPR